MSEEVKTAVEALAKGFEEFKSANDLRLKEIEQKGAPDPVLEEKMSKIQDALDAAEKARDAALEAEKKSNRGRLNGKINGWELSHEKSAYQEGFGKYLRKGVDSGLDELQRKAMSVSSDPDGGYLVLPERNNQILQTMTETSPMRQLANVVSISSDAYEQPRRTSRGATGGWVSEQASRSQTNAPQIGLLRIPAHEIYAEPAVTQRMLDDPSIDIETWLGGQIADEYNFIENTGYVAGSGVGQPTGILSYANGTGIDQIEQVNSGTSGSVTADGMINLQSALKEDYLPGSVWMMNRLVKRDIRKLKDTTGRYLWEPGAYQSLPTAIPDTILGYPVYTASDMPVAAANSLSIAFGNFKRGYTIVDRLGIRVLRDNLTAKPFVLFYSTKRVGGAVVQSEAIKLQKLA